jgi:hypothetical protein
MDGALSIVVGLALALLGTRSVRLLFFASGFGLGWLLAAAFSASAVVSLLVGVAGGVSTFVLGLIAARVAFFAMGALVGAVVGARFFAIVDRSDSNVLLALIFIPAVAVCAGVAVQRWRAGFLGWVTAIGGSALVLSGLGRLFPNTLGFLADPQTTASQLLSSGLWVALSVVARGAQRGSDAVDRVER